MRSDPDYIVKIDGLTPETIPEASQQPGPAQRKTSGGRRPWIAVNWSCGSVYSRVYRNRAGTAYEGRCPKCGKAVKASIGPGGTSSRFFNAG